MQAKGSRRYNVFHSMLSQSPLLSEDKLRDTGIPFLLSTSSQRHLSPPGSLAPLNGKTNSDLRNIYIAQSLSQRR